jgi:peptidoglycan/xylan/chitin deacetylase (PgdA/CDA1 family)
MSSPVPILLYHSISSDRGPLSKWTLAPELFAAHMDYLDAEGYTPITVTQFAQSLIDYTLRLPGRPVVITFDDGFGDFYTQALPVLRRHGFTATIYIPTWFTGHTSRLLDVRSLPERPMMSWDQIAKVSSNGIECGGHGHSHSRLDTLSKIAAWDEITRCKMELKQHLGQSVFTFAYPDGHHNPVIRQLVQQAGYTSACSLKPSTNAGQTDRFSLARIPIGSETSVQNLKRLVTGAHPSGGQPSTRVRTRRKHAMQSPAPG